MLVYTNHEVSSLQRIGTACQLALGAYSNSEQLSPFDSHSPKGCRRRISACHSLSKVWFTAIRSGFLPTFIHDRSTHGTSDTPLHNEIHSYQMGRDIQCSDAMRLAHLGADMADTLSLEKSWDMRRMVRQTDSLQLMNANLNSLAVIVRYSEWSIGAG